MTKLLIYLMYIQYVASAPSAMFAAQYEEDSALTDLVGGSQDRSLTTRDDDGGGGRGGGGFDGTAGTGSTARKPAKGATVHHATRERGP